MRYDLIIRNGTIVDVRDAQARVDLTAAQVLAAENQLQLTRNSLEQLVGTTTQTLAPLPSSTAP